jgi:hypothetical protein
MRTGFLIVLLGAAAGLVAGCGGGNDEPSKPLTPKEQVRAAANRLTTTYDSAVVCNRLVTQRLIDDVFEGDRQACRDSSIADPPKPGEGTTKVVDVAVSGPTAKVEMRQAGGVADGAGGHYSFAREGRAWKLDGLEIDYLHSVLVAGMVAAGKDKSAGAFAYPPLRDCLVAHARTLKQTEAETFVYASLRGDQEQAAKAAISLAEKCPDPLGRYVAKEIADALAEHGSTSDAFNRCVRRNVRDLLSLTDLASTALKGTTDDASKAALESVAAASARACKGK